MTEVLFVLGVLGLALFYKIITYILVSIGYMKIFRKCNVAGKYAFIPLVREYHIGICADKESDAKAYTKVAAIAYIINFITLFLEKGSPFYYLATALYSAVYISLVIYMVRIYLGLIKVFGRSRKWVWAFVLFEAVTTLYWGFSAKFQPKKTVTNLKDIEGARVSGINMETMTQGLTVNITDRTAVDFFKKKVLLKDIHMNIPRGHMVLLLGGSGAGKTTYLNAVTGYEKADASILLDGRSVYEEYGSMMYDIGFVPQQDLVRGNDTVAMTLYDAASLRLPSNVSLKKKRQRVQEVLEEFGLAALSNSLVEKLSGGQRKRLSIAMEFISDPTLFILDEPDSGLDGVVARGLFEKLRAIADQGKIVIVITHTPDRVIDLFDDVIVLAKDSKRTGRLAWYGPVDDALKFFEKKSMEEILLSINQKEEGGEGRADEFVEKYADRMQEAVG